MLRTMTHKAAYGLISQRDFVDVVVNMNNEEFVGTLGMYSPHYLAFSCLILMFLIYIYQLSVHKALAFVGAANSQLRV